MRINDTLTLEYFNSIEVTQNKTMRRDVGKGSLAEAKLRNGVFAKPVSIRFDYLYNVEIG